MKKLRPLLLLLLSVGIIAATSSPAYCQSQCNLLQVNNAAATAHAHNAGYWFSVMELPGPGFYSIYKASKGA
jgi:hypothetical protein